MLECYITNTMIRGKLRETERGTTKNAVFTTARVDDPDMIKDLESLGVRYAGQYESPWFKTFFLSWVVPLLILFVIWRFVFKRFGPASSIMTFGKSKGRLYAQEDLNVTFDDVAGIDEAKEELQEIVEFLKTPEKFRPGWENTEGCSPGWRTGNRENTPGKGRCRRGRSAVL